MYHGFRAEDQWRSINQFVKCPLSFWGHPTIKKCGGFHFCQGLMQFNQIYSTYHSITQNWRSGFHPMRPEIVPVFVTNSQTIPKKKRRGGGFCENGKNEENEKNASWRTIQKYRHSLCHKTFRFWIKPKWFDYNTFTYIFFTYFVSSEILQLGDRIIFYSIKIVHYGAKKIVYVKGALCLFLWAGMGGVWPTPTFGGT